VIAATRLGVGLSIIAVAGIGGVLLHRALAPPPAVRPLTEVIQVPLPPADAPRRVIPMAVPDLTLADLSGKPRRLSEWTGHPVIFNFWATWCDPCRREIPLLIRLRHERAATGLAVVGVAVDFHSAVADYAHHAGIDYPVLIGEDGGLDAVNAFGMQLLLPFSVFADNRGRVVAIKLGELHADEAGFILDRIQDVDRGTLTLEAARQQIEAKAKDLAIERAKHA
jgi:thiol-disulfide isomerase/thioredoxin